MGVGEEDRLPRVRSKPHDVVSGRVAKGRNETHAGQELRGNVLLQLHRVTTSRRVADAQPESAHERFPIPFSRRGSPDKERGYRRRFQLWDSFFDAAPARSTGNSSPSACLVSLPGRHRDTVSGGRQISSDVPLEFPRFQSATRCARLALPVRPKDDGEEVLDLGFLDHSVDSADRAANLSSDSRDGEAGCSESGDPGMPLSLGANDCLGPRSRATRFAGHLLAKPKAPGASGAFVILLHSSRPYIDG
jgi:hypothetical protein